MSSPIGTAHESSPRSWMRQSVCDRCRRGARLAVTALCEPSLGRQCSSTLGAVATASPGRAGDRRRAELAAGGRPFRNSATARPVCSRCWRSSSAAFGSSWLIEQTTTLSCICTSRRRRDGPAISPVVDFASGPGTSGRRPSPCSRTSSGSRACPRSADGSTASRPISSAAGDQCFDREPDAGMIVDETTSMSWSFMPAVLGARLGALREPVAPSGCGGEATFLTPASGADEDSGTSRTPRPTATS